MYTITICLGLFLGMCGNIVKYDNLTAEQCYKMKAEVPKESLGKGYVTCVPQSARRIE